MSVSLTATAHPVFVTLFSCKPSDKTRSCHSKPKCSGRNAAARIGSVKTRRSIFVLQERSASMEFRDRMRSKQNICFVALTYRTTSFQNFCPRTIRHSCYPGTNQPTLRPLQPCTRIWPQGRQCGSSLREASHTTRLHVLVEIHGPLRGNAGICVCTCKRMYCRSKKKTRQVGLQAEVGCTASDTAKPCRNPDARRANDSSGRKSAVFLDSSIV